MDEHDEMLSARLPRPRQLTWCAQHACRSICTTGAWL